MTVRVDTRPESHPAELSLKRCRLDPGRTLFLVVDVQKEFLYPEGRYFGKGTNAELIPNIQGLLSRARAARSPVIYTHSTRARDSPEFSVFHRGAYALIEKSHGWEIVDELRPRGGDHVVRKSTHDCFHRTRMDALLRRLIGQSSPWEYRVVVTGIQTETCVYHAIVGLHVRNFRTVVPVDCVSGGKNSLGYLSHLSEPAYSYNITLTRSDLLHFGRHRR